MAVLLFPPSHVFTASEPPEPELSQPVALPGGPWQGPVSPRPDVMVTDAAPARPGLSLEAKPVLVEHEPWKQIQTPSWKLTNNIWGAKAGEKVTSYVYAGPGTTFGWYWDRPYQSALGIGRPEPLYPNARIGGSPWHPSTSPHFPIRLKDTQSLEFYVAYNYPAHPSGAYNLSYDIFLSDTKKDSSRPRPRAEVMIWIDGTATQPAITYKGDYSDGYHTFQLYSWTKPGGMKYYSFLLKDLRASPGAIRVDARKLMEQLELNPGWYIHGIELGSEIWDGSGKIEITRLDITLNGSPLP